MKAPTESEVIAALKGRLADFKVPKRVFVVEELPRNAMGKVQKNLLRERFGERQDERAVTLVESHRRLARVGAGTRARRRGAPTASRACCAR